MKDLQMGVEVLDEVETSQYRRRTDVTLPKKRRQLPKEKTTA